MAVRMVPHGRRGWAKIGEKFYPILNAQVSQPRNLIVPPVLSRDYEFAFAEGVRTAQITMQIPLFHIGSSDFGSGLEDDLMDFMFKREDNLAQHIVSDTTARNIEVFDGVNYLSFTGVKVNRVSMSIQKGQVLVWNLELMATQLNLGANYTYASMFRQWGSTFPAPRSFRDVLFMVRDPGNNQWRVFKTPVYNADFTIMHNLALNMPITDDTGANIPGAARLDAGAPAAMVSATFQAYRMNKTTDANMLGTLTGDMADLKLMLDDNAGFGVRLNAGSALGPTDSSNTFTSYWDILFPRVIAENRDDTTAQFGQQFRTLRFRCLGDPRGTVPADEYAERYPYIYAKSAGGGGGP